MNNIVKINDEHKTTYMPLLLEADPYVNMVNKYLDKGDMYAYINQDQVIGVVVVLPLSETDCEIKNISVLPEWQHKGVGKALVAFVASQYHPLYPNIYVGTSENGIPFYEKCGFGISHIVKDFFVKNYPEPIYDEGKQCVDMIYLKYITN